MTEFTDNHSAEGRDPLPAYRQRRAQAMAFEVGFLSLLDSSESQDNIGQEEALLNAISNRGISEVSKMAWERSQLVNDSLTPADPSMVRNYLTYLHTIPPLRFNDIGSIDAELVTELGLTYDGFIDQIRALLTHIDSSSGEMSVLDLPKSQNMMFDTERSATKKFITKFVIELHGVAVTFDKHDEAAWIDLQNMAEELSSEVLRDYSRHLRDNKYKGREKQPIQDVQEVIDLKLSNRQRAIDLAKSNLNATPYEQRRALETMHPNLRKQVEAFFRDMTDLSLKTEDSE